jgi:resolvase-like protein
VVEGHGRDQADAFGVNIPQEPLGRVGFAAGDKLRVTVRGKAMFPMCGVCAEFERSMIRQRIHADLARAKASGKQ